MGPGWLLDDSLFGPFSHFGIKRGDGPKCGQNWYYCVNADICGQNLLRVELEHNNQRGNFLEGFASMLSWC